MAAKAQLSRREFVALTALLISLSAMSIDSMLPALGLIAADLEVANANDTQLVVSSMFLGLALAQMFWGPLSDGIGRKPAIGLGLIVFLAGTIVALVASSFEMLLAGRVLQGVGAAGPRIVSVAAVRDQFAGSQMASIMSLVMAVFIIVPTLAPAIGQLVLEFAPWRVIFLVLLVQGAIAMVWFGLRQPETLAKEDRLPLSLRRIGVAITETVKSRVGFGYTIAAGLVSGAFLGYLSSAQQIFVDQYHVGRLFPVYFGSLALTLGAAAIVNSRLVERLGMRRLCFAALVSMSLLSVVFLAALFMLQRNPSLVALMLYLLPLFFCVGILFGNFNSLALEPLGHIAGTASAVIGSVSTFIGLGLGVGIGRALEDTVTPLVGGFAVLSCASLGVMWWIEGQFVPPRDPSPSTSSGEA